MGASRPQPEDRSHFNGSLGTVTRRCARLRAHLDALMRVLNKAQCSKRLLSRSGLQGTTGTAEALSSPDLQGWSAGQSAQCFYAPWTYRLRHAQQL